MKKHVLLLSFLLSGCTGSDALTPSDLISSYKNFTPGQSINALIGKPVSPTAVGAFIFDNTSSTWTLDFENTAGDVMMMHILTAPTREPIAIAADVAQITITNEGPETGSADLLWLQ